MTNRRLNTRSHMRAVSSLLCILLGVPVSTQGQITILNPDYSSTASKFGEAIGFVDDLLLVTAPASWNGQTGTIFTYRFDGTTWASVGTIEPDPSTDLNWFGQELETTNNRIAIAANGTVHVLRHENDSTWVEEFAYSTKGSFVAAFSDDFLAVRPNSVSSDSMQVFERSDTTWSHHDSIYRQDVDEFAGNPLTTYKSACFSDQRLIVTDAVDTEFGNMAGAVRSFELRSGEWSYEQKILPPSQSDAIEFGRRISCLSDRFIVSNGNLDFFVYEVGGSGDWELIQQFRLSGDPHDGYVLDLASLDGYLVVGELAGVGHGLISVFRDDGDGYRLIRKLPTPRPTESDGLDGNFGNEVAISRAFVGVGAPDRYRIGPDSVEYWKGEAYVFQIAGIEHSPQPTGTLSTNELTWSHIYPNPGRGAQTVEYTIPIDSEVVAEIYSVTGQLVLRRTQGWQAAGEKTMELGTHDLPSGVYFLTISAQSLRLSQSFVVL